MNVTWQLTTSADISRWPTHSTEAQSRHCMTYKAVSEIQSFAGLNLLWTDYLNPMTPNRMTLKIMFMYLIYKPQKIILTMFLQTFTSVLKIC
jgi:hypothetical protein